MKYYILKIVLAFMVIATALNLCIKFAYPSNNYNYAEDAISLASFLEKNNISIDPNIIDMTSKKVYECTMTNVFSNKDVTANTFLGAIAEKRNDSYYIGNSTVYFTDSKLNYFPETPVFSYDLEDITQDNAGKKVKSLCKQFNINTSDCNFGISSGSDRITVSVMPMINKCPVFNDALIFEMSPAGLHSISGIWYTAGNIHSQRYALSISDALIAFMNNYADKNTNTIITDIQLGYNLIDTVNSSSEIKPVWRITVENNAIYYIDA